MCTTPVNALLDELQHIVQSIRESQDPEERKLLLLDMWATIHEAERLIVKADAADG